MQVYGEQVVGYTTEIADFCGEQIYLLRSGDGVARILPSVGFNCIGFNCQGVEVIYAPPDADALKERPSGFGVPILFPFPNRIEGGRFTFDGETVQLDVPAAAPHAIHGYVLDKVWEVVGSGCSEEDGAWVTCKIASRDFSEVSRQFPFPFEVTGTYRLKDSVLSLEIRGVNVGEKGMPAGLGLHPYFPLPMCEGGTREGCRVKVPANKFWPLREDCIPTGEKCEVCGKYDLRSSVQMSDRTYDDVWTDVIKVDGWSRCEYSDPLAGTRLRIEANEVFREWVVYAPGDKPVLCFEPYTCVTNAVNLEAEQVDAGLVRLAPGEGLGGVVRISCLPGTTSL